MITVAVIIPYYQKTPGILQRALASISRQQLAPGIAMQVIIVDDGSPASMEEEIKGFELPLPHQLQTIRQKNNGAAAARNTGLLHASKDAAYIAFLDSDDIWNAHYLSQAITTLERGYDYYFCDCRRTGDPGSYFAGRNFREFLFSTGARCIERNIYEIDQKIFFEFSLRHRVSMIPATVFRRSVAPDIIFDTSLTIAGEDCLFLFQVIARCRTISCSLDELVTCADGINIYAGSYSWDDPKHLMRQMASLLALYQFRRMPSLSSKDDNFFLRRIKKVRQMFAFLTVRYLLKHRQPWPEELTRTVQRDARFWRWYPLYVLYVCACFPLRIYDPLDDYWCAEGEPL